MADLRNNSSELVSVVESADAIPSIESGWRALAEAAGNAYLTPEWFGAFRDADRERPFIVAVSDLAGALRGVVPLVSTRVRGLRVLRFAGSSIGDEFGALSVPGQAHRIGQETAAALRARADRWSALILHEIPDGDAWLSGLLGELGSGYRCSEIGRSVHPTLAFESADWDAFLASLSSGLRSTIRRRGRRLSQRYGAEFREAASTADVREGLAAFAGWHERRAREMGWRSTLTSGSPALACLEQFALAAADRGWLRQISLTGGTGVIAITIGWSFGHRYQFFQTSFDDALSQEGPGLVAVAEMLRRAQEEGVGVFDLGAGDAGYKLRFTSATRSLTSWFVCRRGHPASIAVASAAGARNRAGPRVRRLVRRLRRG